MLNVKFLLPAAALVIIAVATGFYFRDKQSEIAPGGDFGGAVIDSSLSLGIGNATDTVSGRIGTTGDYKIEVIPLTRPLLPKLNRPVTVPSSFDSAAAKLIREKMKALSEWLKKNQTDASAWSSLAVYRKIVGDYDGAREIWEFMVKANPSDFRAFANLGELYHLYLKEYAKSELNYKRAIALEPKRISLYRGLHELYSYSYKQGTSAAADILKEGLGQVPDSIELMVLLGHYYRAKGDVAGARAHYEKAIAEARKQGNETLVSQIEIDLNGLNNQ